MVTSILMYPTIQIDLSEAKGQETADDLRNMLPGLSGSDTVVTHRQKAKMRGVPAGLPSSFLSYQLSALRNPSCRVRR